MSLIEQNHGSAAEPGAPSFLAGGGECGTLIARADWSASPLGPLETWPLDLRVTLSNLLRSPVATALFWGQDGIFLYNDRYAELAGGRHPDLLGRPLHEAWPEIVEYHENIMRTVLAGGSISYSDMELTLDRPGRPKQGYFDVSYSPVQGEEGEIKGVLATVQETTERVMADRRVAAERERLRRALERVPGFVTITAGPDHLIEFTNESFRRLFGDRDYLGKTAREAFPELESQGFFDRMDHVYASGERFVASGVPVRFRQSAEVAEEELFLDFIYEPVSDETGKVTGIFCEGHDVTEAHVAREELRAERERYRTLSESIESGFCIVEVDLGGPAGCVDYRVIEANPAFYEQTGFPEAILGRWLREAAPTLEEHWYETYARVARTGESVRFEQGSNLLGRWFEVYAFRAGEPEAQRVAILFSDISARRSAEAALAESEARFRNLAEHSPAIMWMTNPDGDNTYLNTHWFEITGQAEEDTKNYGWISAIHPDDRPFCEELFVDAQERKVPFRVEFRIWTKKDGWRWVLDAAAPRWGGDGAFLGFVGSMIDITDRKEAEEALARERAAAEHAARHDSLTGLPNRSWFRSQLEEQLGKVTPDRYLALLFLDLDGFASVNDSLGHPAGDALLRAAGARLRGCLRGGDLVARFGGDEFAILQTGVKRPEQVEHLAQRIIASLSEPYRLEGRDVVVAASIGIAMAQDPGVGADVLLKRSDIALYQAKAAGRGVPRFFEPAMEEEAAEDQRVRAELRDALKGEQLCLYYQPVMDLEQDRVLSFEALLRWQHPRRGLLGPAGFIGLAEETGEIEEIGAWVLREACATAASWPEPVSVSVNLSPRQFRSGRLLKEVCLAIRDSSLPASRLTLEITESVFLEDEEVVHRTLDALRGIGVQISIDDFGTGYSSLGYLRRFPVDAIKIDRSFVADLPDNPKANAIVRAALALSTELDVALIAEGVETPLQMDQLRAMGCRQGQGYLFSRPMPADDLRRYLIAFSPPTFTAARPDI